MVTFILYGLDQFVVGRLSRELTGSLAKLYETDEDQINFVAPENMIFHHGVEQTSWNLYIHVHAPEKYQVIEKQVANFILHAVGDIAIHKIVEFYYYAKDSRYELINKDYPRYIKEDNLVDIDEDDYEDYEEGEGEDQIFTGDIFKDFNPKN